MFRAKGLVFLGARDFYEMAVPAGFKALLESIEDEGLRCFFIQPFIASGWYDATPIAQLAQAAARLCGVPYRKQVRENARWLAERDLTGVYRRLVALASAEKVALRLPQMSMRYFDFGRADGRMIGDGAFESNRYGVPARLAKWFALVTEGFVPYALQLTGATNVRVRSDPPKSEGFEAGIPIVRLRFEIRWDAG